MFKSWLFYLFYDFMNFLMTACAENFHALLCKTLSEDTVNDWMKFLQELQHFEGAGSSTALGDLCDSLQLWIWHGEFFFYYCTMYM